MHDDESTEPLPPSKSQLKREMTAKQKLGERLLELNEEQLLQLALPAELIAAIELAKRIKKRGGLYRQLQYIGKLMRSVDIEPIVAFFELQDGKHYAQAAVLHELEQWRERLIMTEDHSALTAYLTQFPHADRQQLRQLIQVAKKERQTGQPLGAGRKLFRYLRDVYNL